MPGFADIVENIQDAATTIVDGGGGGGSGDSGIAIAGESLETGGSGSIGWLSSTRKAITSRLPGSLGQKSTANSLSVGLSTEQETILTGINGKLPTTLGQKSTADSLSVGLSTEQETILTGINGKLPTTLGQKTTANSLSVGLSIEQEALLTSVRDRLPAVLVGGKLSVDAGTVSLGTAVETAIAATSTTLGAPGDTLAPSDTGSFNLIQFFKRLLNVKLPSSLGQKSSANGFAVTFSTEQETILTAIRDRFMPVGTITPYLGTSAGANLKASAGNVYAITCTNLNSATRYFQLFAKASAPTGGDTPVHSFPVYGNGGLLVIGQDVVGGGGIALSTGVTWGISSTALTYTAATASETIATVRWA